MTTHRNLKPHYAEPKGKSGPVIVVKKAFDPDWVVAPGATLREWRVWSHLPVSAAATACGRMPLDLYEAIEAGTQPIDERIAEALAHGTQIPAFLWMNLERAFRAGLAAGKHWSSS